MNTQILGANVLLLSILGLLCVLGLMERLAGRALSARNARWHQHYSQLPAQATVVAERSWQKDNWITAYSDHQEFGAAPTLCLLSQRPLTPAEHNTCLRWLLAEGFDSKTMTCIGADRQMFESDAAA